MAFWDRFRTGPPKLASAPVVTSPPVPAPRTIADRSAGGRYGYGRPLSRDEATDATPLSVQRIFDQASTGDTTALVDLYKHSRLKDDRLDSPCATRVMAVQGRAYAVKPPPGYESDPRAVEIARRVATIFNEARGFKQSVGHLAHAPLEHLAVLQHDWRQDHRGWWVSRPQWEHPNRFGWSLPGVQVCWSRHEAGDHARKPLSLWPDQFVVHSPVAGRSDYPWARGAMRSRVAASVVKRMGFRWWLKMLERWGQPQVYAQRNADASTDENSDDVLSAMFRELGSQWSAVVPAGVEISTINAAVAENLHRMFVEYNDTGHSIAILGQNLSTEISKGGSFAAAKAHNHIRLDILASDLEELGETITDQWIEPICRYNWPGAPVPYLDFVLGTRAELTVQAYMSGAFSTDEFRASMGHDPETGGRGRRYFAGAADYTPAPESDSGSAPESDSGSADATHAVADVAVAVADLALNGAQIQALQGIVLSAGVDLAPRTAELVIVGGFPTLKGAAAEMIEAQSVFAASRSVAAAPESPPTETA